MGIEWSEIHQMEVREDYPRAIVALEERLAANPSEPEAVIRLGFNLWYAVVENDRMCKHLPTEKYAHRFMELYELYKDALGDNSDFCWAFGLGISMFWYYFPGSTEELGNSLIAHAKRLDPFWEHLMDQDNRWRRFLHWASPPIYRFCRRRKYFEEKRRLGGRGIFQSYYAIK